MYPWSWEKMIIWSWNNFKYTDSEFSAHDAVLFIMSSFAFASLAFWRHLNDLQVLFLSTHGFQMCPFFVFLVELIVSVHK